MSLRVIRKSERRRAAPETVAQAQRFGTRLAAYLRLGACEPCAAQGAFAFQEHAGPSRPPCAECAPLVAALPGEPQPRTGWKLPTRAFPAHLTRPRAVPGSDTPDVHDVAQIGTMERAA